MGGHNRNKEPLRIYPQLFIQQLSPLVLDGLKKTDCVTPVPYVVCFHSSARAAKRRPNEKWMELGLAFGIPILGLIFSVLLLIFNEATRHAYLARMTVLGFIA